MAAGRQALVRRARRATGLAHQGERRVKRVLLAGGWNLVTQEMLGLG